MYQLSGSRYLQCKLGVSPTRSPARKQETLPTFSPTKPETDFPPFSPSFTISMSDYATQVHKQ